MKIRGSALVHYTMDTRGALDDVDVRRAVIKAVGYSATVTDDMKLYVDSPAAEDITIERGDA